MLIPEVTIHKSLISATKLIVADLAFNSGDETKSRLYDMFGKDERGVVIDLEGFNYFEQSKQILKSGGVRQLRFFIGYNLERFHIPTVHILLPSEIQESNGIGASEGYHMNEDGEFDIDYSETETIGNLDVVHGKYTPAYTFSNKCTYMLLITSENYHDVIIVYHYLKYILSAMMAHFELCGFQNVGIGGQDLQTNFEIIPAGVFHRNVSMNFSYEFHAKDFTKLIVPSDNPFNVYPTGNHQF